VKFNQLLDTAELAMRAVNLRHTNTWHQNHSEFSLYLWKRNLTTNQRNFAVFEIVSAQYLSIFVTQLSHLWLLDSNWHTRVSDL
jgi:hypothetical protein